MVQAVRARGQRVILTLGGSGAGYCYTNRTQSNNAVASLQDIIAALGGVDGIDFNNYEQRLMLSNQSAFTTEMTYIGQQLKSIYGSDFILSTPAATTYPEDKQFCAAMISAGALDYAAPQFYDWSAFSDPGFISGIIDDWVDAIGANHLAMGLGASYSNGTTLTESIREWNASKAAHPDLLGMFGWNYRSNRAGGNVFGTTMVGLL
jgi:chitinase